MALTTDSYVVKPLIFPGGDIGALSVFGTVNDLAMAGAAPLYLTAGFVLEEGCSIELLRKIVSSMSAAADEACVHIVTGDTKVVDRGKGDGIYINTAGVGRVLPGFAVSPSRVRPGDAVIVSGDIGRHGVAVLSVREGIEFDAGIVSDVAPLSGLVASLCPYAAAVHCLRDLTRGGLSSALNEIALDAGVDVEVDETKVPVCEAVSGACELLGLDPFYVACEGRMVAFVEESAAGAVLGALRGQARGSEAQIIGRVSGAARGRPGRVTLIGSLGGQRVLDLLSGEQLPRIC